MANGRGKSAQPSKIGKFYIWFQQITGGENHVTERIRHITIVAW